MTQVQAVKWYILLFLSHFCCLINFIHPAAKFVNTLIGFKQRKSHRKKTAFFWGVPAMVYIFDVGLYRSIRT